MVSQDPGGTMKFLWALLAMLSTVAAAGDTLKVLDPKIVANYLRSASEVSRYPIPKGQQPIVKVMSAEWFLKLPICEGRETCSVMGLFYWSDPSTVYLNAGMQSTDIKPIFIHELVHWLQHRNGVPRAQSCAEMASIEAEAYTASHKFSVYVLGEPRGFWAPIELACEAPT